jgi:hypothetical protein
MTGMWATPVVQINFQEFSIEGLERARNSPFPGGLLTETLPQNLSFRVGSRYYREWPDITVPGITGNVLLAAIVAVEINNNGDPKGRRWYRFRLC